MDNTPSPGVNNTPHDFFGIILCWFGVITSKFFIFLGSIEMSHIAAFCATIYSLFKIAEEIERRKWVSRFLAFIGISTTSPQVTDQSEEKTDDEN